MSVELLRFLWQEAVPLRRQGSHFFSQTKFLDSSTIFANFSLLYKNNFQQECIPVGCVPPACCPYLPACTNLEEGMYLVRGCTWFRGGVPGPGGCTWSRGMYLVPGPCTWSWGVYLVLGGYLPRYSPPVNRILDTRFWKYYLAPNFVCGR